MERSGAPPSEQEAPHSARGARKCFNHGARDPRRGGERLLGRAHAVDAGPAEPELRQPEVGKASQEVPVVRICRGCPDSRQYVVIVGTCPLLNRR